MTILTLLTIVALASLVGSILGTIAADWLYYKRHKRR